MKRLVPTLLLSAIGIAIIVGGVLLSRPQHDDSSDKPAAPPALDTQQTSSASPNPCEWNEQIDRVLPKLLAEYGKIEAAPTIEKMVSLDAEIRGFINSMPQYFPCGDHKKYWDDQYARMGIHLGYWDLLGYSEALLVNAHKMNPRSRYRSHTLFSTIMGIRKPSGLGEMPDIKAAYRYAEEFPDGPFIKETLAIIADFHKDLFMTLRDDLRDYKYDCYKPYIDDSSRLDQMERAKHKAIENYEKLIAIDPSNERAKSFLEEVRNGTVRGWSFCAD